MSYFQYIEKHRTCLKNDTDLDYGSAEFMAAREQTGLLCVMRYCQLLKQYILNDIFKNKNKTK